MASVDMTLVSEFDFHLERGNAIGTGTGAVIVEECERESVCARPQQTRRRRRERL